MPWAAAAAAAASLGSAAMQSDASRKAAHGAQDAANAANGLTQAQYQDTVNRNQPFYQSGIDALQTLNRQLPTLSQGYDPSRLQQDPGFQFGLQQGQQALERSLAARGAGGGGAAMKAAARYGTDYGNTKLNDAFSRDQQSKQQTYNQLMGLTQLGQNSANNTAALGNLQANSQAKNIIGAGDVGGLNSLAQGNIAGNAVNQFASIYKNTPTQQQPTYLNSMPANSGPQMPMDLGGGSGGFSMGSGGIPSMGGGLDIGSGYFADGGPVYARPEPKIGTYSPLPSGGGGGLSKAAVLQALTAAQAASAPQKYGVGALPANPVTNPGAILADRLKQAEAGMRGGGPVQGPGGPRDDAIPARLSNGEHVIDADTVNALGDGDNVKGQAVLNEMRARVKAVAAARMKGGGCAT